MNRPMIDPNAIGAALESIVKRRGVVHYSDLVREFNLPPLDGAWSAHPLSSVFDILDRQDAAAARPFRSSVAISHDANMPGAGYFDSLQRLSGRVDPRSKNARMQLWLEQFG